MFAKAGACDVYETVSPLNKSALHRMSSPSGLDIVALITGAFHSFGGIETFNRSLVKALDQIAAMHNLHVRVLSLLDENNAHSRSPYLSSGRVEFCSFCGSRSRFALAAVNAGRAARFVLIGHVNFSSLALLMGAKRKYLVVYGIDAWRTMTFLQRVAIGEMRRIISISSYTADRMRSLNGIEQGKFVVVPVTLDPTFVDRGIASNVSRDELGLPGGPMILSVSRLSTCDSYKNIDRVIHSFPNILKQFPEAFYVVVGDGDDSARLKALCGYLGVASKIFFPGRVDSNLLPAYFKHSDIFVLPSTNEGFGIVFLEAMYYGKPCIGVNAGGVPEVVRDGTTGLLVDQSDVLTLLPGAILRLLNDPVLRSTMGERGRNELDGRFSFGRFRDRLEQVLCEPGAARCNDGCTPLRPHES